MDSVIDMNSARALVGDAALWPKVRDFLWDFAPQIYESWLKDLGLESSPVSSLMSSPRVRRFILERLGVEPCFHAFPKGDWSRLLLLDGATLQEIARWLGALLCADGLRRVTAGATVRELKSALPGVYPEVFGYTMYFGRELADAKSGFTDAAGVVALGLSALASLLADLPGPLVARLKFKLPKDLAGSASPRDAEKPSADVGSALSKLLKLKFPEAYSLCCS
ncbi:MAG: hypothetical protein J6U17_06210 [Kiritimatiellae bacterium]|nr:hypothetical protein [Kiritimatiellia bacterium]